MLTKGGKKGGGHILGCEKVLLMFGLQGKHLYPGHARFGARGNWVNWKWLQAVFG